VPHRTEAILRGADIVSHLGGGPVRQFIRFVDEDGQGRFGLMAPEGVYRLAREPYLAVENEGFVGSVDDLQLLPPVLPGKIICIGLNYRDHAAESGSAVPDEPVMFMKPPSCLVAAGQPIVLPRQSTRVDYEGELAVVIGREVYRPDAVEARRAIFGYTCANDVTARDLQKRDGQWTRAKAYNTFGPLGPIVAAGIDPGGRRLRTRVNGRLCQDSSIDQMVFSPEELVYRVAAVMTLFPGDVLLTGTPAGVGPLSPGDTVEVHIEGVGVLTNPVQAQS